MRRMIYVPQFPAKSRYQEWHYKEHLNAFEKHFDDVIVLGKNYIDHYLNNNVNYDKSLFSPANESIFLEQEQIKDFLNLELTLNDYLFMADISFPGFFTNVFFHKRIQRKNCFCYCHATALNNLDYFSVVRSSKTSCENIFSQYFFDTVFVATDYHKNKIKDIIPNTKVIGLPNPPSYILGKKQNKKKYDVVSVSRVCEQKVNAEIEECLKKDGIDITRKTFDNWKDYYKFLSESKILLSTAREETYGYQIIDAYLMGCKAIAPKSYSYPELLSNHFLYSTYEELLQKIKKNLVNDKQPELKDKIIDMSNKYYDVLIENILGEKNVR